MNPVGMSDSVRIASNVVACPKCGSVSRVGRGSCLNCLVRRGLDADPDVTETLEAVLDEVDVRDGEWRLGNYQILEEIGRGGMGVIYRARQRHSCRIVAVKRILGYHSDSHDTLVRFRREAQAAASLDHPNILPIYEVSESEDGLPFFSMRFAAGGNLQEASLGLMNEPRRCVALIAKIARAVQHAHGKGILHRDLKPGNILLDGCGEPLVSDFGLAKWLDTTSDLTRSLTVFGTPGYIAPEQASGPAAQLKPTADVYSLGAILFDLLAGRPPFLGSHALSVIRQASEAPAPKLRSLSTVADRDLETICARCLEREPSARYQSAHDLAEDLERWLEGRPILARPVSLPVRSWRWSRRNPILASLLVVITGLIIWQVRSRTLMETEMKTEIAKLRQGIIEYPKMEAQLLGVRTENLIAEQERIYAQLGKQLGIDPKVFREEFPRFANQLKESPNISSYERANASYVARDYAEAERLAMQAAVEAKRAHPIDSKRALAALELAGLSAHRAAHYDQAMLHFREGEELTDRNRNLEEWVSLQHEIADLLIAQGKYGDAEKLVRNVIEVRTRILGPEHLDTLESRHRLIYSLSRQTKYAEAEAEARDVLRVQEKVLGSEPVDTSVTRYYLADALVGQGKFSEAESLGREIIPQIEEVFGSTHPRTLAARLSLATALSSQGKNAEAEVLYREIIKLDRTVYGPEHPDTLSARQNLATALQAERKYPEGEAEYRDVIKIEQKTIGPEHPYTLISRNNLAEILDDEGKFAEAEAECRQIIALEEKTLGPEDSVTLNSRGNLAVALIGLGKFPDAEVECRDVLTIMERVLGFEHPDTLNYTRKFATGLSRQSKADEAMKIATSAEERASKALGADNAVVQKYAMLVHDLAETPNK